MKYMTFCFSHFYSDILRLFKPGTEKDRYCRLRSSSTPILVLIMMMSVHLLFFMQWPTAVKQKYLPPLSSNKHELVAPVIDVINTYFNRPDLEIGAPKSDGANMGSSQHWADSIVAKYPHSDKFYFRCSRCCIGLQKDTCRASLTTVLLLLQ